MATDPFDTGAALTLLFVGLLAALAALIAIAALRANRIADGDLIAERMKTYDVEEVYRDCTVVIWRDTGTGETLTAWWPNEDTRDAARELPRPGTEEL